jgi:hypothetical protein
VERSGIVIAMPLAFDDMPHNAFESFWPRRLSKKMTPQK